MPSQTQIIEVDDAPTSAAFPNPQGSSIASTYPEQERKAKDKDVRDMLRTLADRKWFILAVTVVSIIASFIMTLSITPTYRAEAIMKIEPEASNSIKLNIGVSGDAGTEEYYRTQYRLLQSKAMARKVIDALKIEPLFSTNDAAPVTRPFYADAVESLQEKVGQGSTNKTVSDTKNMPPMNSAEAAFLGGLSVTRLGKSHLVSIAYESTNPVLSANIVNSLTKQFIQKNLDSRLDSSSHAKLFLEEQIQAAKAKLDESKKRMIEYEKENTVVDNAGDASTLMRQRLLSINQAYSIAKQQRIAIETSQVDSEPKVSVRLLPETNLAISSLERQMKLLESKYNRLNRAYQEKLKTYKPSFPGMEEQKTIVDEVRAQIEMLQASIQDEKENIATENSRRQQEANRSAKPSKRSQLIAARQKEAAMKAELDAVKAESIANRERVVVYKELEAKVKSNTELHDELLKKQKEVGVAGGIDNNNISVIDPAVVTYNKYKPNTKMNVAFGALAGLLIGSMLALLVGHSDAKIKSVDDIREVSNLPLLGKIPKVKTQSNGAVHALEEPSSIIAEAFRSLRTSLMFATPEGLPKLLHITSAEPDEGKSNIAHNLAGVFSQTGKNVLLIDADLRKPSIGKYLNLELTAGLEQYLQGQTSIQNIITSTAMPNLSVIASNVVESAPADLLSNDQMLNLLERVSDQFDLIILDSPPVLGLADALILSNRSIATLFVIESNKTHQQSLSDALERLRMGYGNVIGFVLSKSKRLKSKAYTYKYGDAERTG